jgi:hypothetical protein
LFHPRQLTFAPYGHTLNRRQSVSPCGKWIAYDTRNDDAHIARTARIEMVHVDTQEVVLLYDTRSRRAFGPGVGAVSFHPTEPKIVFIHGLRGCCETAPYSAARRFGAILDVSSPGNYRHAESRRLESQPAWRVTFGCLSGGTHAHSWNHQGHISFTYNDIRLEEGARRSPQIQDLRTIGFMIPGAEPLQDHREGAKELDSDEEFSGTYSAFLAANVHPEPTPGSDEISAALEECWVGENGYSDSKGMWITNAIAFQGRLTEESGNAFSEVFITELPSSAMLNGSNSDGISEPIATEPNSPVQYFVCKQRRLTNTHSRRHPGVSGPRHWLASSRSGDRVYFLMRDDRGIAQLHFVSSLGGEAVQVTDLPHSIESQFNLNLSTTKAAFLCDNRIVEADLINGRHRWLTQQNSSHRWMGSVQYVEEERWVCNGTVSLNGEKYIQIFAIA